MTAPAVVFDLDGTLIDSLPDLLAAVNRMLGAEGQPPMDRAEVQSYVGDGAPRLVARVMAAKFSPSPSAPITARVAPSGLLVQSPSGWPAAARSARAAATPG